jgi:large subunit ribosomal protein L5
MTLIKEKIKSFFGKLEDMEVSNPMELPRITKAVVSTGIGSIKDKKKIELIVDRLTKITGQKPAPRGAKSSIANFKTRQGDIIGYQVTLRGQRMFDFLDRLLNIALPRSKDFRGISKKSIDNMGNITIGIKEHTIFPETSDEDLKDVFGLSVTITTTASTKERAQMFLEKLGLPLEKKKVGPA